MSIFKVIGFVVLLTSPHAFAGMMTLDMEDFTYWDNYGFLQTGGRLSLTIRTDGVDESIDGEKGFYTGVITGETSTMPPVNETTTLTSLEKIGC